MWHDVEAVYPIDYKRTTLEKLNDVLEQMVVILRRNSFSTVFLLTATKQRKMMNARTLTLASSTCCYNWLLGPISLYTETFSVVVPGFFLHWQLS